MKIYVDTNFLLHEAFIQDQTWAIGQIYALARTHKHHLCCPVISYGEATSRVSNRHGWRDHFKRIALGYPSVRELKQSAAHSDVYDKQEEVVDYLINMRSDEEDRLEGVLQNMASVGELLPVTERTLDNAAIIRSKYQFRLSDSLIAASILIDIADSVSPDGDYPKSLFITEDKDFLPLKRDMSVLNCSLVQNFEHAVEFLKNNSKKK
ncbi:MAG: hypothetical protein ACTHN5_07580 [Phycisphaerae bacterium]